jgi:hypothetical protein
LKKLIFIILLLLPLNSEAALQQFTQYQPSSSLRRAHIYLVDATDGITPETGEVNGQPTISINGATAANTSATLTHVANGHYYVTLTVAEVSTEGWVIIRYKSANTADYKGIYAVTPAIAENTILTKLQQLMFTLQKTAERIQFLLEIEEQQQKTPQELVP